MRVFGDREISMGAGVAADQEIVVRNAVRMCPSGALRILTDIV